LLVPRTVEAGNTKPRSVIFHKTRFSRVVFVSVMRACCSGCSGVGSFVCYAGSSRRGAITSGFQASSQTQQPSASGCGSHPRAVDGARPIRRLQPDPGGGKAGRTSRLFDVMRYLARLDDRGWATRRGAPHRISACQMDDRGKSGPKRTDLPVDYAPASLPSYTNDR